jgi:hypothetical protein
MSIPDVNAVYSGVGPTASGQILAAPGQAGSVAQDLEFTGTATLDGSATTFNLNWIDGTATLPFTPSGVIASVSGGNQGATAVVSAVIDTITATKCTVRLSATGTNTKTLQISGRILK